VVALISQAIQDPKEVDQPCTDYIADDLAVEDSEGAEAETA